MNPEVAVSSEPKAPQTFTDQELAHQAVVEFFGPDSRYPDHNQFMVDKLEEYGLLTSGFETAVALHDIVDHGIVNPKNEQTRQRAVDTIEELFDKVEDKYEFTYALGIAISSSNLEANVAEKWRATGTDLFNLKTPEESAQILAAINKDSSQEIDIEVLKKANIDLLDTASLRDASKKYDIESFLLNAVQLMHNLKNPPPDNSASTWRDCKEIISCYAPALDLFGFKDIAAELRGQAYEFSYDAPDLNAMAHRQHELSKANKSLIDDVVNSVIKKSLSNIGSRSEGLERISIDSVIESRVKTEGSIRKKLSKKDYAGVNLVPDGIGYKIVVPDYMSPEKIIELGEQIKALLAGLESSTPQITAEFDALDLDPDVEVQISKLTSDVLAEGQSGIGTFLAEHTKDDDPVDDRITTPKESGYSTYQIAFKYEKDGVIVPFEIQVVSDSQEREHTYGQASHLLYKFGKSVPEHIKNDLKIFEARSELLKKNPEACELNMHTWFEILSLLPELKTPVHEAFDVVELGKSRVMIAAELSNLVSDIDPGDLEKIPGDIIAPLEDVSLDKFYSLLKLVSPELADDPQVHLAVEFLQKQKLGNRKGRDIGVLEGHLLPVALHTAMMASISQAHWESHDPSKYLSDVTVAALLHDMVEDTKGKRAKQHMRNRIGKYFGDRVLELVDAMTSPQHIEDSHERRKAYAKQLSIDKGALQIKLPDRSQNHLSDIHKWAKFDPDAEDERSIKKYFNKTLRYLTSIFENQKLMPIEYRRVNKFIFQFGKRFDLVEPNRFAK